MQGLSVTTLGVLLALAAYGVYSTADAIVKGLGASLGPFEIGFFTTMFSVIPALVTKPRHEQWRQTFRLNRPWLVHWVAVLRTACAVLITYSFVSIPLAEAYSIAFMAPVFTTILSVVILREKVTLDRWVLVITSFLGVLLVVRPGFRELELGHLTALGCAICSAFATIAMRQVSGTEKRISLVVYPALYTLTTNAILLVATGFVWPAWSLLLGLFVCGLLGGAGYLLQLNALQRAPASQVAPAQYSQIVWALSYGAIFFGEFPDAVGLAGLVVVVTAGVANVFADGARARIAGRWMEYRARRAAIGPTGFKGPGPDPV